MKKVITGILTALLALSMAAFFAACGGDPNDGDGGGNTDATSYTVTAAESDFYDVNGQTRSATAGTAAYVVIEPQFEAVSIDKVLFNGQECTESATEENRYEFTMPAANVEITVEYSFTDNESDNFAKWSGDIENEKKGQVGQYWWVLNFEFTGNRMFGQAEVKLYSMNEQVIPAEALSYKLEKIGSSANYGSGYIKIDGEKIHAGSAQLVMTVKNTNVTSNNISMLVITVEVTDAAA